MNDLPQPQASRVFIVDDHPIIREYLAQLIEQQPDMRICGEAVNLPEAIEGIGASQPDIAIIDISLRSSSGLDLIKEIRARGWTVPILVLSMHEESLYAERVLRAGALGFVNKQDSSKNILLAIRRVIDRQIHLSPEMSGRLLKGFISGPTHKEMTPVERLGDRELEVFQMIGRGCGTLKIAETMGLSVKTVETYRARIKEKLAIKDGVELLRHAMRWVEEYDARSQA